MFNDDDSNQPDRKPRRLQAPKLSAQARWRLRHYTYREPMMSNPYAQKIIAVIEEMAVVSGLPAQIILKDWLGMIEGKLSAEADSIKISIIEGRAYKDTPEYYEHFRKVRERFLHRMENYNLAAYEKMNRGFLAVYDHLLTSAQPLEGFTQQALYHPDVIGQVFVHFFPNHQWKQYFCHSWVDCLTYAAELLPSPEKLADDIFMGINEAATIAKRQGVLVPLDPEGNNELEWLRSFKPFYLPTEIILGQEARMSAAGTLLAAAALCPHWMRDYDFLRFIWCEAGMDPLIERLWRISAHLYGLNGAAYKYIATAMEITEHKLNNQSRHEVIRWERDRPAALYFHHLVHRYGDEQQAELVRNMTTEEEAAEAFARLAHLQVPADADTSMPLLVPPPGFPGVNKDDNRPSTTFADLFRQSTADKEDASPRPQGPRRRVLSSSPE